MTPAATATEHEEDRALVDDFPAVTEGFGHWLAGFIDGEGSFTINKRHAVGGYGVLFQLCVRDDDSPIVVEARERTGIGRLYRRPADGNTQPRIVWHLTNRYDACRLVALLDRYPLRAKKRFDYEVWREAVLVWLEIGRVARHAPRGQRGGRVAVDWSEMAELRDKLMEVRRYA